MKVKIIIHYEMEIEEVTKITIDNNWDRIDIHTKTSLTSLPRDEIQEISFIND